MAYSDRCFMIDVSTLEDVVGQSQLLGSDLVLEVGAGNGNLTEVIAKTSRVSAIEKEDDLFAVLKRKFSENDYVDLIHADALKVEYPMFNKIVSNIPYSISRQLMQRFILEGFERATLVVQEEFAQKLGADPAQDNYRMVSALVQSTCEMELLDEISPRAFRPSPQVDSRLIRLSQKLRPDKGYIVFLNALFSQKNKKVRNILASPEKYHELRPAEMTSQEFLDLYSSI